MIYRTHGTNRTSISSFSGKQLATETALLTITTNVFLLGQRRDEREGRCSKESDVYIDTDSEIALV